LIKRRFDHVGSHQFDLPGILPRTVAGNAKESSLRQSRIAKTLLIAIGAQRMQITVVAWISRVKCAPGDYVPKERV
jgi:hypothetical protein